AKEKSKESILDDDIYKRLINEGGLVNDVNLFVQEMQALENDPLNSVFGDTNSYLKLIGKVNNLVRNKQNYIAAIKEASQGGGLNEVAVDPSRNVYYRGEDGKVKTMNLSEYKTKSSK